MAVIKSAGVRASRCPQQAFDLAPHLFDGIEVRRIGRQEEHLRSRLVISARVGSLLWGERLSITTDVARLAAWAPAPPAT